MLMHQTLSKGWCLMDLDSFLTSLYVLVDDRISEIRGLPAALIWCCGLLREAAFSCMRKAGTP